MIVLHVQLWTPEDIVAYPGVGVGHVDPGDGLDDGADQEVGQGDVHQHQVVHRGRQTFQ